jgi:hypothetical protein
MDLARTMRARRRGAAAAVRELTGEIPHCAPGASRQRLTRAPKNENSPKPALQLKELPRDRWPVGSEPSRVMALIPAGITGIGIFSS